MKWFCRSCRSEFEEKPQSCGTCFQTGYLTALAVRMDGRNLEVAPRTRRGVVPSTATSTRRLARYPSPWSSWQIEEPHAVVLVGGPGQGKSTAAASMAVGAAGAGVRVLYVSAEEGVRSSVSDRLARVGLDARASRNLSLSDARTVAELVDDLVVAKASLVVLDSLTELGIAPDMLPELLAGRSWIGTVAINGKGEARGGPLLAHVADVVVMVDRGIAKPSKNRFGVMTDIAIPGWQESRNTDGTSDVSVVSEPPHGSEGRQERPALSLVRGLLEPTVLEGRGRLHSPSDEHAEAPERRDEPLVRGSGEPENGSGSSVAGEGVRPPGLRLLRGGPDPEPC